MKTHPCRTCPSGDKDKNNKTCMQCDKRIQYVFELEKELFFSLCNPTVDSSQPYRSSCGRFSRMLTSVNETP
jgi:hypothetical protein